MRATSSRRILRGRRRTAGMAAGALALVAACSGPAGLDDGGARATAEDRARGAVREAELIGSWRTPVQRAERMGAGADVLSYSGDAEHSTYVIRTVGEAQDAGGGSHRATVCFGVEFDAWTGRLDGGGDCPPDAVALDVVAPPVPTLPATTVDDLTAALTRAADASSEPGAGDVEAAVRASAPGGAVDVAEADDGAVGVALSAGRNCVLGRITAAGAVEVWVPPAVLVAPGEQGCSGDTAARGLATTAPH